jgi:hypothetical protein
VNCEQRLLTALRGGQPDRVPVAVWLNPLASRWATGISSAVDPQAAGYGEVLEAAREYADPIYDWYAPSGLLFTAYDVQLRSERIAPERVRHTIQTPKGELTCVVQDRSGGGVEKHWVESLEEMERLLSIPYVASRPDLSEFLQTRERLRGVSLAQVTLPDAVCGLDPIAPELRSLWTITERDLVREILDISFRRISDLLDYLLEGGVGPLYYFNGPEYAIPPLMSPRDFEEFVVHYDQQMVAKIHDYGHLTQIHCHGRTNRFLERFVAIGTDSLNPLEPPPLGDVVLADAKRRVGQQMCLVGNIQYEDLASASLEGVEALVREAIVQGAPGGGFILSLCAAPYEVPLPPKTAANLIHFMKMGRKYGQY